MKPPIPIERARRLREQHPEASTVRPLLPADPRPAGMSVFIRQLVEVAVDAAISAHELRHHRGRRA
jgi:hypothetical protein